MPAVHPHKQSRNTVGLRNAAKQAPNSCPPLAKVTQNNEEASDERWQIGTCFDSVRPIVGDESDSDTDADIKEVPEWGDLEDEDFQEHLVDMARAQGDNPMDEDWLPPRLLKKRRKLQENKKCTC